MITEQYFQPGDKVTRVAMAEELGLLTSGAKEPRADFGIVLCVEKCSQWMTYQMVHFVGINEYPTGFYACCFRKIEDIKLCVAAAKRMKKPTEKEPEVI